jgi:glycosyltransferase involved in cell wall biosynthesis
MTLITCVHQGFELYGSDRAFVETVRLLRARHPGARIDVVLPRTGPIVAALEVLDVDVVVEPLWILRRRDLPRLATLGLLQLPLAVARALRRIRRSDLVYVNTCVVTDYLVAAGLCPGRTVLHLHEIPQGAVLRVLRALVRWSRADLVYNSRATEAAFASAATGPARVVYNRIADPGSPAGADYDGDRPLRLLMLGRISRIKGQEVLVEALRLLPEAVRTRVVLRIVGSAFEDRAREETLAATIADAGLDTQVTLLPFTADPEAHFRWADVVAVPSRLPESLGRVAIEAMAHGRPPIVSDIGGLPEVVENGVAGWVVPPDDPRALSRALAGIVTRPAAWRAFPAAARRRYEALFGGAAVDRAMVEALDAVLARQAPAGRPDKVPA